MPNLFLRIAVLITMTTRRATNALAVRYQALRAQPATGSADIPWTAILIVIGAVLATAVGVAITAFVMAQLDKLPE